MRSGLFNQCVNVCNNSVLNKRYAISLWYTLTIGPPVGFYATYIMFKHNLFPTTFHLDVKRMLDNYVMRH